MNQCTTSPYSVRGNRFIISPSVHYGSKCLKGPFWTKKVTKKSDYQQDKGQTLKIIQTTKTNIHKSFIDSIIPKETYIFIDLIRFEGQGGSSDFFPHLSPLCLADTIKGRDRKKNNCNQASTSTCFAELSFRRSEQNSGVCRQRYIGEIYMSA